MSLSSIDLGLPRRLAHLPLIMDVLRRSRVIEIIDEACGVDRRQKVSHGECVAMIIAGVFAGEHGLWRLRDRLDVYDMATVMQDPGIDLDEYHDVRLGRACDAIYDAGPDRIHSALALHAIDAWKLDRSYLHVDTTTLSFYGAYESDPDEMWLPEIDGLGALSSIPDPQPRRNADVSDPGYDARNGDGRESPLVVRGYAKNKRHDLKQILYGSVVTRDGGVPLYARVMDGNASDITAATEFLDHLRRSMTGEPTSCFVVDSKGWNPRVLRQVHEHRLRVLSRLPRTTDLSRRCLEAFDPGGSPCLLRTYSAKRSHWNWIAYRGTDEEYAFTLRADDGKKTTVVLPVRTVVCFSSKLFRQKAATLKAIAKREEGDSPKRIRKLEARVWRCEADARTAADELLAKQPFLTRTLTPTVVEHRQPAKRGRGRPRRDAPPNPDIITYRLAIEESIPDAATTDARLRRAATYILIRNRLPGWELDDEAMVAAYSDQWRVEHGFAWLKSEAALNPVFLESPRRIEAIGLIYHIALMIHTLIQRGIRAGLRARKWKLPYHRNKPSDNITARFLYELFRNVTSQTVTLDGECEKRVFGRDTHTDKAITALGVSPHAYMPVLHATEK